MNSETFGQFLHRKRAPQLSMRELGKRLHMSVGYMCDIENDRKDPPTKEVLAKFAEVLALNEDEYIEMLDLAGKGRREVAIDLPDYIMNSEVSDSVRLALRTAKNTGASVEDWLQFVDQMLSKQKAK